MLAKYATAYRPISLSAVSNQPPMKIIHNNDRSPLVENWNGIDSTIKILQDIPWEHHITFWDVYPAWATKFHLCEVPTTTPEQGSETSAHATQNS